MPPRDFDSDLDMPEPPGRGQTQTKTQTDPFSHLHDLDSFDLTGSAPTVPPKAGQDSPKNQPKLKTSSAANTRQRVSAIRPSDHMRDMMSRIDMTQDDEIDDAEAARRAGVGAAGTELDQRPVTAQNLPSVLSQAVLAAGQQQPEWHTINNLPGYMRRAIRGMGRQIFSMMTRTPHENIMTIANVDGQGPNTSDEIRAVAGWLRANGQDLGPVEVNHGRAIPGYESQAHDFSAMGIRFHVVQDPMGQYIYAWPEQDSRTNNNQARLGASQQRLINRESITMDNKQTLAEELALYKTEKLMESQWTQQLLEEILSESSLSRMIGETPGGQLLVRWMHRKHLLSNDASYMDHPFSERMMWTEFKNHPDNFLIVTGTNGVAGIKPNEADIQRGYERARKMNTSYNPARDNTLRYQIVAFRKDGQVDPALLRDPREVERDADPTVMRARGGMPSKADVRNPNNIFDRLAEQIGRLQAIYITRGSVEREKIAGRKPPESQPADLQAELSTIAKRIRPVLKKLGFQAISIINNRAKRYIDGGNFDKAQEVSRAGANIKQFLTAIDTSGELNLSGYNNPISKIFNASLTDASGGLRGQELANWLAEINRGNAAQLGPILDAIRANFMKVV